MSNHELMQIFYDGLGVQDRYLLDAASGGTFMSKYEDDAMELIETVAENSHHNAAKPFGRGLDAKNDQHQISGDGDAPRMNRQNGRSLEFATGPTQYL